MSSSAPGTEKTPSSATDVVALPRPEAELQFAPGTVVAGRYRISGMLGAGGMGEVFRADDLKLGQQVALKFLPAKLANDPMFLRRLHEEVRLGRLVSHPNVCRIHDIAEWEGGHFVAMEYIEGEDLSRLLKRIGRFSLDKAADIARGIAAGLLAAHAKGVLHRDLKPANVMIDSAGEPRIMDFGLALSTGEEQTAMLAGTPGYVAPEQLEGKRATVQSDLYALGLVMYELITGSRVYNVRSFGERVARLAEGIPKPSTLIRGIDPAVEAVILRCLANDPEQRPRSAREVIDALPRADPLAAAIEAGETPSPRLVAAAAAEGSLKPAIAFSLLAVIVLEAGFAFFAFRYRGLFGTLHPKAPQVLTERAEEIRAAAGVPNQNFISSGWKADPQHLAWVAARNDSPTRFEGLRHGLSPIWFWLRAEPAPLIRDDPEFRTTMTDPPQTAAGASTIAVDPRGRLVSLTAIPDVAWKARPADWRVLFAAAGLDAGRFTPAAPRAVPPVFADARGAWNGLHPDDATPIRVEAAMWRGTPVFFRIAAPWDDAPDQTSALPFTGSAGNAYSLAFSVMLLVFALLGVLLAARNLRMRRGDRKGAARVAAVLFILQMISAIGFADHAMSATHETRIILKAAERAVLWAAGYFLVYIALEPFVRRRWPSRLISWMRLLAGNWRDPMVGRDVLIGVAAGLAHAAISLVPFVIGIAPLVGMTSLLQNAFAPIAWIARQVHSGIVYGLTLMIALMFLAIVLRRRWLGGLGVFALLFVVFHFGSADPRMLPVFAAGAALVAFTVARFGLLAAAAYCTTFFLFVPNLLPAEIAWYTPRSLIPPLLVLVIAAWGFYTSQSSANKSWLDAY